MGFSSKDTSGCPSSPFTVDAITEICVDHNHITISVDRYDTLMKAKVTLDMLESMYRIFDSFDIDKFLKGLFGPRKKDENA